MLATGASPWNSNDSGPRPRAKRKLDRAQPQEEGRHSTTWICAAPNGASVEWRFKTTGLRPWLTWFRRSAASIVAVPRCAKRRGLSMRMFLAFNVAVMFALSGPAAAQAQENPGVQRPVTQQEIDRLKRQIDQDTRSSVEAIMDYHTESGDLNNRLDFFRYGGRLNLKLGSSGAFQFRGMRTEYL